MTTALVEAPAPSAPTILAPEEAPAPPALVDHAAAALAKLKEEGCPVCKAEFERGPERDAWTGPHCWKCGYNAGQKVPAHLVSPQSIDVQSLMSQLRADVISDIKELLAGGASLSDISIATAPPVVAPGPVVDPSAAKPIS